MAQSMIVLIVPCAEWLFRMVVDIEIEKAAVETLHRIEWLMELEKPPFTLNDPYFSAYREKYLAKYRKLRRGKA